MTNCLTPTRRRRLDIQGFDPIDDATLVPVARWLRLAFGLCITLAAAGLLLRAPALLWALAAIASLAALFPVHPFDLVYNFGIRHLTGTAPLPRRGPPSRFACGLGSVWMVATILLLEAGHQVLGQLVGWTLVGVGTLVSTTVICIPSLIYRSVFGFPAQRGL